jgi:arylsulfatase A-like enzyme
VAYSPSAPRFIWVVFDEWDHYLTFEHRPAGLELPELDRFRAEAFDADTAYSPAINTNEALPSLMSGRIVKQGERSGPSDMVLTFADTGNTALWSTLPNVFQRARPLGVNTAMIGYHHPYSRIVGRYVTESYSLSNVTLHQEPVYWRDTHGFRRLYLEVEESLIRIPMVMHYLHMFNQRRQKRAFRIAYIAVHDRALKLAARPDLGLLMIHLPIPHPPGIYDRGRRQVTTENHASYVDNLALLDVTLGELRKVMESQGQWDKSFVLLTSDHPLRAWEGEEYLVMIPSPKQPRIPFLLKLPGRQTHLSYEPPFNTVLTQELVLAALRGELREPGDVARWLDANRLRYPTTPIMQAPPPAAQAAAAH